MTVLPFKTVRVGGQEAKNDAGKLISGHRKTIFFAFRHWQESIICVPELYFRALCRHPPWNRHGHDTLSVSARVAVERGDDRVEVFHAERYFRAGESFYAATVDKIRAVDAQELVNSSTKRYNSSTRQLVNLSTK